MGGAAMVGAQVAGAGLTAYSQYQSGQWNKRVDDLAATDALQRGEFAGSLNRARGTRAVGAATAAAAGSGVDVQSGSVLDVVGGTRLMSALDSAMIRSNALREAYGYTTRGSIAEHSANNAAIGTLLTGFGQAGMSAYHAGLFNKTPDKPGTPYALAAPGSSYDPSTRPGLPNNPFDFMPDFVRGN